MQVSSLAASRASRRLLIPCRAASIVGWNVGAAMLDMGTRVASTTGRWAVGENPRGENAERRSSS